MMIKKILVGGVIVATLVAIGVAGYQKGPGATADVQASHVEHEDYAAGEANGNGRQQGRAEDHEDVADTGIDAQNLGGIGQSNGNGSGGGNGQGAGAGNGGGGYADHDDHELLPALSGAPLTQTEIDGLLAAIDDEYHAWAIYDQVLVDFGDARPFINIINSEAKHIDSLVDLFERYDISVPENEWVDNIPSFDSLQGACQAGVDAEVANAALYDTLFASTDRSDILGVYQSLQSASANNHKAAFERCAAR